MNRMDLVRAATNVLRQNDIKKPISIPKQVFYISDDEGNTKEFYVKKRDKTAIYTVNDVSAVVDAVLSVIEDTLKRGESVSVQGFGTLYLKYRSPRVTKKFGTDEDLIIEGRYVPKFAFGNNLRMCAKVYELSLDDKRLEKEAENYNFEDVE